MNIGDFVKFVDDKIIFTDEAVTGMNNLYYMESVELSENKYFITYVINNIDKSQYGAILTLENGKIKIDNSTWINNQVSYNIQLVKLTETKILMLGLGTSSSGISTSGWVITIIENSISRRNCGIYRKGLSYL